MRRSLVCGLAVMSWCASAGMTVRAAEADVEQPTAVGPSEGGYVNLNLEGVGADEAFDQLAKQSNVELTVGNQQMWFNTDAVEVRAEKGYFWPVFLDLCKQANVRFDPDYNQRGQTIRLNIGPGPNPQYYSSPRSVSNGFVVMATNANRSYSVAYGMPQASASFSIQLTVFCDPQAGVSDLGTATVTQAEDESGKSLIPDNREGRESRMFYGGGMRNALVQNAGINLANPKDIGKQIRILKGVLPARVVTKVETLEMDAFDKPVRRELSDFDVTIELLPQKEANPRNWQMRIIFAQKPGSRAGLRREFNNDFQSLINTMNVHDKGGKRLMASPFGGNSSDGVFTQTVNLMPQEGAGAPAKLVWKLPKETRQITIPFEFKDLPVP